MVQTLLALSLALLNAPVLAQTARADVRIGGSSTVFPIMQQAVAAFRRDNPNNQTRIELNESGTSAGLRQFCKGQLTLANASRPINSQELELCARNGVRFVELPIAFDAVTVVVNPANTAVRHISIKQLNAIWDRKAQGRVLSWDQIDPSWPQKPLKLCGPGADSGTFDYFNKAVNGDSANSRTDYTASEDDAVLVRCVSNDVNALGYFGYAYYASNPKTLKALWVLGGKGLVAPSLRSVQSGTYVPLSRPLFIYGNARMISSDPRARRFLTFTLQNGLQLVRTAGYIPLPSSTYRLVEAKVYRQVLGSAFNGELTPGLSLSVALQRSLEQIKKPLFR